MSILLVRSVTLEGAGIGLIRYIKPDFLDCETWEDFRNSKLFDSETWVDSATQVRIHSY